MARNAYHQPPSLEEIQETFRGPDGKRYGAILTIPQFAELCQMSKSTVYEWVSRGHLKGVAKKRGKRVLIWRDSAVHLLFNGPDWKKSKQ